MSIYVVICTTEFGRQPAAQGNDGKGRDRNAGAFTAWLVGGGISGGTSSPRHKPWTGNPQSLEWVPLESSLQWQAFQRLVGHLQSRGNDIYVIVGPLNQHKLTEANRARFLKLENDVGTWLKENNIPHWIADTLPSKLYADASHPLTQGYRELAEEILGGKSFTEWLGR